ncbi:MAG: hypothetical protein C6I00_07280 [Nitratiruptor sp.]|nr:hypothetical protein [Nitratiruptor sp.]NPA83837.1 NAD-glutamate dehydrogenase [Campylobacterota bacterium]
MDQIGQSNLHDPLPIHRDEHTLTIRSKVPIDPQERYLLQAHLPLQEESYSDYTDYTIPLSDVPTSLFSSLHKPSLTPGNWPFHLLAASLGTGPDGTRLLEGMMAYLTQLLPTTPKDRIIQAILAHPGTTKALIDATLQSQPLPSQLPTQDPIFTLFHAALQSIRKTNLHTRKETLAIKLETASFQELLEGFQPQIEGFVYHPDFIGVHLRTSKIARGGIRYSDREDLRQEIRSLMITQEAKNAIIVPTGAKGGLFIRPGAKGGIGTYYPLYIDALLDLIDPQPKEGGDFYFVVAADKGTADLSDVANQIAMERNFWLKDAFASGGSHGYSHKKLGVTAKGAWYSTAPHFSSRGIDIFTDPISVVATGSMRGDVFGNGMLINPNIRLLAAISSKEIFIDPDPDPALAYQERKRLFEAGLGWKYYDPTRISPGGGVFSRSATSIPLSPQIRRLLQIQEESLDPDSLIRALLKLPVDLLYIGGVGTYVKGSGEVVREDGANAKARVEAQELQAFAVCEGGNLGFTQLARLEYAAKGGRINLDHIDNAAGVHTSDYEVNLKIVLHKAIEEGVIPHEQRNPILTAILPTLLQRIFAENVAQSLAISLDERGVQEDPDRYAQTIALLQRELPQFHILTRSLPTHYLDATRGLSRPILGLLLSYAKIFLKRQITHPNPLEKELFRLYFPSSFVDQFQHQIATHPLRKEILATTLANRIIDEMGATFINRYEELGALGLQQEAILTALLLGLEAYDPQDLLARERKEGEKFYRRRARRNASIQKMVASWMEELPGQGWEEKIKRIKEAVALPAFS